MRDHAKGGALTETSFYILLSLYQPNHGYGIMQFIEDTTNGRLTLGAGTLYGALKNLQKKVGSHHIMTGVNVKKSLLLQTLVE